MARTKIWWQDPNDVIAPWVINLHRDPCDCSQGFHLKVTGMSEKQGPTHYCPCCRWAFWPVEMKPSADQINLAKKTDPEACEANMKYIKMRNKPGALWGSAGETRMVDQLGKGHTFLTVKLNEYWNKKYCKKYPSSELAKRRAALKAIERGDV
jgi:hypothetical protein